MNRIWPLWRYSDVIWVLVAPFAAWAVLRLVGVEPAWQWVPLVAFTPYVAAVSVVPAVVAAFARKWVAAGVAAMTCLALAACVLPRFFSEANPDAGGGTLRVLAANLRVGNASPEALVALVRRLRPDALALQELTPGLRDRIDELGLRELLPYRVDRAAPGVRGSAVLARYPVSELPMIAYGNFRQARAMLPGGVEVVSVHPCAPRHDRRVSCWREGLDALPRGGGQMRVLAGDFNATLDHRPMRDLLRSGYRDAADVTGQGFTRTWPELDWSFLPAVAIDHVLASSSMAVAEFGVYDLAGTDHRPVFAVLRLP